MMSRKCHSHEAQPSRDTGRDEEKVMTNATYETTGLQEELQQRQRLGKVSRKTTWGLNAKPHP